LLEEQRIGIPTFQRLPRGCGALSLAGAGTFAASKAEQASPLRLEQPLLRDSLSQQSAIDAARAQRRRGRFTKIAVRGVLASHWRRKGETDKYLAIGLIVSNVEQLIGDRREGGHRSRVTVVG